MKEFWNMIQLIFAAIGGWLGWFLGGYDGLLYALIAFVVIDYITGVMCAVSDHTLSSEVGFRGICRKVLIFLLVGIANILDVHVIGTGSVLRTAIIFFYISNFLNTASRAIFSNLSSNGFKSLYLKFGFLFCIAFEITKSATSGFFGSKGPCK